MRKKNKYINNIRSVIDIDLAIDGFMEKIGNIEKISLSSSKYSWVRAANAGLLTGEMGKSYEKDGIKYLLFSGIPAYRNPKQKTDLIIYSEAK